MDEKQKNGMLVEILKAQALPRKHASFFNWHDKEIKELDITTYLAKFLSDHEGLKIKTLKASEIDPPDCLLIGENFTIAVEVVELVDKAAIEAQIKERLLYPDQEPWSQVRLMGEINRLIKVKDNTKSKDLLKSSYNRYALLIHTDEPELNYDSFEKLFNPTSLLKTDLLTEVYILFSYHPVIGKCFVQRLL